MENSVEKKEGVKALSSLLPWRAPALTQHLFTFRWMTAMLANRIHETRLIPVSCPLPSTLLDSGRYARGSRKDWGKYIGPVTPGFRLALVAVVYPHAQLPACLLILTWLDLWRRIQHDCVLVFDNVAMRATAGIDDSLEDDTRTALINHLRLLADMLFDCRYCELDDCSCDFDLNIFLFLKDEHLANRHAPYVGYIEETFCKYIHVNSYQNWRKVVFTYQI